MPFSVKAQAQQQINQKPPAIKQITIMTRPYFNRNWIARVDWQEIHCLLGYNKLVNLLDDTAPKVFARLDACKADKLIVRPFHGAVITFYAR